MSPALRGRPGVVTGGLAFLAAACSGLVVPFRGDLSGPFGFVPPLAIHLVAVAVAPGLAAYAGYRLVRSSSVRRALPWAAAAALVGAAVGRAVGTKLGFVLITGSLGRGMPRRLLVESYVVPGVPFAVAATVGVVGGLASRRVTAGSRTAGVSSGLLAIVGGCGVVAGFALVMTQFGYLFAAEWTLLPEDGWMLLGLVGAPLASSLGGWARGSAFGADGPKRVGAAATVGVALGAGGASLYAGVAGRNALPFLSSQLDTVVVDAVVVAVVVALAAVVGAVAGRD